jgi:hypothetical protein
MRTPSWVYKDPPYSILHSRQVKDDRKRRRKAYQLLARFLSEEELRKLNSRDGIITIAGSHGGTWILDRRGGLWRTGSGYKCVIEWGRKRSPTCDLLLTKYLMIKTNEKRLLAISRFMNEEGIRRMHRRQELARQRALQRAQATSASALNVEFTSAGTLSAWNIAPPAV